MILVTLKAIGMNQAEDFANLELEDLDNLFDSLSQKITQIASGGENIDDSMKNIALDYVKEDFSSVKDFKLAFGIKNRIKIICKHYNVEEISSQTGRLRTSMTKDDHIQQQLNKFSSKLTVLFKEKYPNTISRDTHITVNRHFLAECPMCHQKYSVVLKSKGTLVSKYFFSHIKTAHSLSLSPTTSNPSISVMPESDLNDHDETSTSSSRNVPTQMRNLRSKK